MTKRKEDWIYINTPEGKQLIASPGYIKELLGLKRLERLDAHNVYSRLEDLESRVRILERPLKKAKILELLEDGKAHNYVWLENRISESSYWSIRELTRELIREEKLEEFKAGTQSMFRRL